MTNEFENKETEGATEDVVSSEEEKISEDSEKLSEKQDTIEETGATDKSEENASEAEIEKPVEAQIENIAPVEINGKPKKGWKRELLEWVESLGIAVIVALLITNFVFTMVKVDGLSMEPTLHDKNNLFVFRLAYTPKNGDIVVLRPKGEESKFYIKRVIATENQTIDIKDGYVYLDGEKLVESYVADTIKRNNYSGYPKTVPAGHVFVMGDNRNNSSDSRDEQRVGMVERKRLIGKALFRVFPFNQMGGLYDNYEVKHTQ